MKTLIFFFILILFISCSNDFEAIEISRYNKIPPNAQKMYPEDDKYPPIVHSDDWEQPIPMSDIVNSAGCEDSPFIYNDLFLFFFTPDINVPVEKQLLDSVTGIWYSIKKNNEWTEPQRVWLDALECLDGAPFTDGEILYFASVRQGNYGEIDIYCAAYSPFRWFNIVNAGEKLNVEYDIGELHIMYNHDTLYYAKYDGHDYDIWKLTREEDWTSPERLNNMSDNLNENQPFITKDGRELWFTAQSQKGYTGPAIYRCIRTDNGWSEPVEIISNFAGEPTLDNNGNIYFVHHFFDDSIIEADIYIAVKR